MQAKERRACSYRSVAAILQNNLDKDERPVIEERSCLPLHENIRGADDYDS